MALQIGLGKSSQFAHHVIDTPAQEPPGIPIRQDGNARFGAKPFGFRALFF